MREGAQFYCIAAAIVLISAGTAIANPQAVAPPLKPIDQNVADVNALSVSLRDLSIDLRLPLGFQHVYEVPGQPGMLMRSSGALYAVFPNSTYVKTPIGPLAKVPPGTVFYIGLPPTKTHENVEPSLPRGGIETRVTLRQDSYRPTIADRRIDRSIPEEWPETTPLAASIDQNSGVSRRAQLMEAEATSPTVANHEGFRALRLAELLRRATRAAVMAREAGVVESADGRSETPE